MLSLDDEVIEEFKGQKLDIDNNTLPEVKQQLKAIKESRKAASLKSGPKIKINGSVSLIEQKPFILNATLRDNILFGEELDSEKYNKVLHICQLGKDLELLKGGDLTEIGEKGINLSGGQKARVSIARAVYANKDIILMDDPLSALDAHVKRKIFDKVCCQELKNKTRILVTHAIEFLEKVDRIIIMQKGVITHQGSYDQLKDDEFFKHIISHIAKTDEKIDDETRILSESDSEGNQPIKTLMSSEEHKIIDKEEDENLEVTWGTFWSYLSYAKLALLCVIASSLISLTTNSLDLMKEYLLLEWVKEFSQSQDPKYDLLMNIVWKC